MTTTQQSGSWAEVLQVEPPVVGQVDDYSEAARQSAELCEASRTLNSVFARIRTSGIDDLKGHAADALREVVMDMDNRLADVPVVLEQVEDIFLHHERRLQELREEARRALARAKTRWDAYQQSERQLGDERSELGSLLNQRGSIPRTPENDDWIARIEMLIDSQTREVKRYEDQRDDARGALCHRMSSGQHPSGCSGSSLLFGRLTAQATTSCDERMRLHAEEQALVRRTVGCLGDVDLRGLKNPGWWDKFIAKLVDVVKWVNGLNLWMTADFAKAAMAAFRGEWGDALHYLRDGLEKVAFVAAVAAMVASIIFTGGAAMFVWAAVGASIAIAGSSVYLAGTGHPHPETGKPVSWGEAVVDMALVPLGGAGVSKIIAKGYMRAGAKLVNKMPRIRQYVKIGRGVYSPFRLGGTPVGLSDMKGYWKNAWKRRRFLWDAGSEVVEFGLDSSAIDELVAGYIDLSIDSVARYVNNGPSVFGLPFQRKPRRNVVPLVCTL